MVRGARVHGRAANRGADEHVAGVQKLLSDGCPQIASVTFTEAFYFLGDFDNAHVVAAACCDRDTIEIRANKLQQVTSNVGVRAATIEQLLAYAPLARSIKGFWSIPAYRQSKSWIEHGDINTVMIATSLMLEGYIATEPTNDA